MEASPALTIEFPTEVHHGAARGWLAKLSNQRLTYTDAVSLAVMEASGCTAAMGFDHDFVVARFPLWRPA